MDDEILANMYASDDAPTAPQPQPEQLRLAGKATLIPHKEGHVAVPRIEWVEEMARKIASLVQTVEEQKRRINKLEHRIAQANNIAERRLNKLESPSTRWDH